MGNMMIILIIVGAIAFRFSLLASVIGWLQEGWRDWFFGEHRRRPA